MGRNPKNTPEPHYGPPYDSDDPTLEDDAKPPVRRSNKAAPIRGPPPIRREAFTIAEFCRAFRISGDMFFKIQRDGWGPKTMKVGTRTLISVEAADAWRREREAAAARDYCMP